MKNQLDTSNITEHPNEIHKKLDLWKQNFSLVYEAIKEKSSELKMRVIVKETVSFGMQCYAAPKVLQGLGKLFKQAHKQVITFANNIPALKKTNALTTPEGVIIRIAENAAEYMKNELPKTIAKHIQISNMSEFFKHPFGQILSKKSQKLHIAIKIQSTN